MNPKAIISWNDSKWRYELHIDNKLKAYSEGYEVTKESHEEGKQELVRMVEEKGYEVELIE